METWKPLDVSPDYAVSDMGNVKRISAGKRTRVGLIRRQFKSKRGYKYVTLRVDGKPKGFQVHRLVMLAFAGPSDLQVNHKNGDKSDNRLKNLEYVTASTNRQHASKTLDAYPKGSKHPNSKLTDSDVRQILALVDEGLSDRTIGRIVGCTGTNVMYIRQGKAWGHISTAPRPANYKGRKSL